MARVGRRFTASQREWLLKPLTRRLWAGLAAWIVAVAAYFVIVVPNLMRLGALAGDTVEVSGRVVSQTDANARINRRSATRVTYEYEWAGAVHRGSYVTIDEDDLRRFVPGAPIRVRVAVDDPSESLYAEDRVATLVEVLILFEAALGVLAFFAPLAYLVSRGRRWLRVRELLRYGELTEARVFGRYRGLELDEGPGTGRGKPSIVRYAFEVDGEEYVGELVAGTRRRMNAMVPRDTFEVAYDPSDPSRNCWHAPEHR